MPRVLLFTASFGTGHNQACQAIKERLEEQGAIVRVVDFLDCIHPLVRTALTFLFLQVVKKLPSLYGAFYRLFSGSQSKSVLEKPLFRFGEKRVLAILRSFQPDVVCNTFPTSAGIVSELRRRGLSTVPNVVVITDYTVHEHWVHDHVELYCVASPDVGEELHNMNVPNDNIQVTGLPIRRVFDDISDVRKDNAKRRQLRQQNHVSVEKPLFLVMGGGEGILGKASEWTRLTKRIDAQFVIVCGQNRRLYNRLRILESDKVRVFGFISNVEQWMAMADLLITKAGGLTVTEALTLKLPMLLFHPIPGQEYRNACYAVASGLAQLFCSMDEAERILTEFVQTTDEGTTGHFPALLRGSEPVLQIQHCDARLSSVQIADHLMSLGSQRDGNLPVIQSILR